MSITVIYSRHYWRCKFERAEEKCIQHTCQNKISKQLSQKREELFKPPFSEKNVRWAYWCRIYHFNPASGVQNTEPLSWMVALIQQKIRFSSSSGVYLCKYRYSSHIFLACLFLEVLRRITSTEKRFLFFNRMSLVLLCISRWASLTDCKTQRILWRIIPTVGGQLYKGKAKPQKSYYTTNMATLLNGFQLGSFVCPAEYGGIYSHS